MSGGDFHYDVHVLIVILVYNAKINSKKEERLPKQKPQTLTILVLFGPKMTYKSGYYCFVTL